MPRKRVEANIARMPAIRNIELLNFVTDSPPPETNEVLERAESIRVSTRDFTRIIDLIENPPAPNARLRKAIASLPDRQ
ncbi:MAG: DUF1778 domain-containing protein [Thermomicrobiales bacterium]|nr:DUF1778 domain-containing protein [Thermomicrobiales bacterium]